MNKNCGVVSIGLSEVSCVLKEILRVWNCMNHYAELNPRSMVPWAILSASGSES